MSNIIPILENIKYENKTPISFWKLFFLFPLFLTMAFPYFTIPIKLGSGICLPWGYVTVIFCCIFLIIFKTKFFIKKVINIFKEKPFKLFCCCLILEILLTIIHIIIGNSSFKSFAIITYRLIYTLIPLFYGYILLDYIRIKTLIKVYYLIILFILLFGIFDFIVFYFDISFFKKIYFFFVNSRIFLRGISELKIFSSGFPRIQSTFEEPAYLGYFLNIHLPLIYALTNSKFRIFKNNILNNILKKTTPIIFWMVIIGMQSPIHLIFSIIITIVYFCINNRKFLRLLINIIFIILGLIVIYSVCPFIDLSDTYIQRIITTFLSLCDFNLLALVEPSLATRLTTYINSILIFLKHPLIGCGIGNYDIEIAKQMVNSPVPLTQELFLRHIISTGPPNASILYYKLAELGISWIFCYLCFIGSFLKSIKKNFHYSKYIERDLLSGFKFLLICYLFFLLYESFFNYFWIEFGILLGLLTYIKRRSIFENTHNK